MRHQLTILFTLISMLIFFASAKPVFGPIGVAEKHKIAKMLESEQKSLQMLEDEQALLERVVETLSKEIDDKEAHIHLLKRSYTHGHGALSNLMNEYRSASNGGLGARPGR